MNSLGSLINFADRSKMFTTNPEYKSAFEERITELGYLINNVIDLTQWNGIADSQKEIYLRQSTLIIKNRIDLTLIKNVTNLELSTALMANFLVGKSAIEDDASDNVKRINISGAIEKEYFTKGKKSNAIPSFIGDLLKEYGYSNALSFNVARS